MRKVRKSGKLVYGFGINDADYPVGKCPIYPIWVRMLERSCSKKYKEKHPSYNGVSVCEDWEYFSIFKLWVETQDWEGKQLDKDLLVEGNLVYSPTTCIFISGEVNKFMTDRKNHRGAYPLGVTAEGRYFKARCSELGKGSKYLGIFETPEEAHEAYLNYKESLSIILANRQKDSRVADALITRYRRKVK